MDSKDVIKTTSDPADPKPVEPSADPNNPKPISVRQESFSRRVPGNPDPEPEPVVADPEPEPETLTVEEMLEMEDAELASYGIDDPKTWKSYQRLLHKKEAEWAKKETAFEQRITNLEGNSQRSEPSNEPAATPNAPLVKPIKPIRPANYDVTQALTDPASASAVYMQAMDRYQADKDVYHDAQMAQLMGYVGNEQQLKVQQRKREEVKSQSLSRFQQRGLSAKDATGLFDKIEQAYMSDAETASDIFVDLFKGGNGSEPSPKPKGGRKKLPDNIFTPPGVNTTTAKPTESKSSSFMKDISSGNQTKKIILNREKR